VNQNSQIIILYKIFFLLQNPIPKGGNFKKNLNMTAHSSVERLKHWENFVNLMNESTSTQDSKPLPREEILQAKGKMYQMHKQKMKIQLENEQKALSPFSPAIQTNYESKEK
jgi:hypothetical protein